ncbi:hypothetical protein F5884DRAFT_758017 [Xylogone sp. PMI_703]|nr:hypothetical protein F5884DRAFT_758017 [Xylogone sp. PMI_703]
MSSSSSTSSSPLPLVTNQSVITRYNRGPVTAVFTPPASCLSTFTTIVSMYFGHQDVTAYYDPACYPSSISAGSEWNLYYYSPAQCPQGWTGVTTFTGSFTGDTLDISLLFPWDPTPLQFFVAHRNQSIRSLTFSAFSNYACRDYSHLDFGVWTPDTSTWTIFGDGIPVWWQNSDLALFSAAASTASSIVTTTGTTTGTNSQPTSSSTNTVTSTPTPSPSSGLSSGAKIGIGIGVPLAAIAIGCIGFACYIRRRRRNKVVPPELHDNAMKDVSGSPELPEEFVHEMYTEPQGPEELAAR